MHSARFDLAVVTVLDAHGLARRKTGEAYEASHAIGVAAIVADHGFDEDCILAALLHDTLEDTSLDPEIIRARFGDRVLAIVEDLTEPAEPADWSTRKRAYVEQLERSPREGTWAVASADKIHNLSTMIRGMGRPGFWDAFAATPDRIEAYHATVTEMLAAKWQHPILDRQRLVFEEFRRARRAQTARERA